MQPTSRSPFGDVCGVAAILVIIVGLFFPARPGGPSEAMTWVFISAMCLMTVFALGGLRYGAGLGQSTGVVALVFVLLIVLETQGLFR